MEPIDRRLIWVLILYVLRVEWLAGQSSHIKFINGDGQHLRAIGRPKKHGPHSIERSAVKTNAARSGCICRTVISNLWRGWRGLVFTRLRRGQNLVESFETIERHCPAVLDVPSPNFALPNDSGARRVASLRSNAQNHFDGEISDNLASRTLTTFHRQRDDFNVFSAQDAALASEPEQVPKQFWIECHVFAPQLIPLKNFPPVALR